jgi:hypothetical protein
MNVADVPGCHRLGLLEERRWEMRRKEFGAMSTVARSSELRRCIPQSRGRRQASRQDCTM